MATVITHTLQSGQTVAVTSQASAGELLISGAMLALAALLVISFIVQVGHERNG